jgi:hypothetical protein
MCKCENEKKYDTSFCFSWHRLLCHSLVRSEKPSTVDGRLSTEEQTVQECDATGDAMKVKAGLIKIS